MRETFVAAMMSIRKFFEKRGMDGQALVEYALILVLVAIAVFVMLQALGTGVGNTFTTVSGYLDAAGGGGS